MTYQCSGRGAGEEGGAPGAAAASAARRCTLSNRSAWSCGQGSSRESGHGYDAYDVAMMNVGVASSAMVWSCGVQRGREEGRRRAGTRECGSVERATEGVVASWLHAGGVAASAFRRAALMAAASASGTFMPATSAAAACCTAGSATGAKALGREPHLEEGFS